MKQPTAYLHAGLDVGADDILAAKDTCPDAPPRSFPNTPAGFARLGAFLTRGRGRRTVRVCMEATGAYSTAAAAHLHALPGVEVMVANPRRVKAFMKARGTRAKTDAIDARGVLQFVRAVGFVPWQPPRHQVVAARELARRIFDLSTQLGRENNRLKQAIRLPGDLSGTLQSLRRSIAFLEEEIAALHCQAAQIISGDQGMDRDAALLTSIPGFAAKTVAKLIPELAALPEGLGASQWVAHAGIDPRTFQSGSSIDRPRFISKQGNRHIRAALYMPALVAVRCDPHIKAFYESLLERGKRKKVALVAVMRRLLVTIHAILRSGKPFDGARFNPHAKLATP